jgi:hypothetical protein
MRTQIAVTQKFELYVRDLDNHVLIENSAGGVVISATRDNFSDQRKTFFIRHLAAEGYIPDRYEWFSEPSADGFFGVKWITGASASEHEPLPRHPRKYCTPRNALYGCLAIVWLLFFVWAVHHTHTSHGLGL